VVGVWWLGAGPGLVRMRRPRRGARRMRAGQGRGHACVRLVGGWVRRRGAAAVESCAGWGCTELAPAPRRTLWDCDAVTYEAGAGRWAHGHDCAGAQGCTHARTHTHTHTHTHAHTQHTHTHTRVGRSGRAAPDEWPRPGTLGKGCSVLQAPPTMCFSSYTSTLDGGGACTGVRVGR
jgi:hypothetical protein